MTHPDHAGPAVPVLGWPVTALLVLVPAAVYAALVRARGRPWPPLRTASTVVGLVLVALALSPLLEPAGHHDPHLHMVQHLLLGMVAPVALVLGAPGTLLLGALPVASRGVLRVLLRSRALHVLTHPVTAAVLSVGGLHVLYLTPLHALAAADGTVRALVNAHVLASGVLFAWAVAGPDPAPRRPSVTTRAVVLVLAGGAHAHLAKLLYAHDLHGLADAAPLMYYGGDLAELLLAVALFASWYRARPSSVSGPRRRAHPARPHPSGPRRDRVLPPPRTAVQVDAGQA